MEGELSDDDIQGFAKALAELKTEVEAAVVALQSETEPVDLDTPIGRLSRIDAIQQQKMAQANVAAHKLRLRQIAQALVSTSNGTYGACRKCDEPIARRRLSARPESPFCLECQGAKEDR